jgi:tRNA(Arg) A34 adenosine deaminase TadA
MDDRLQHEGYMDLALAQARKALEGGEVPVGAVLVDEAGTVLAEAHNRCVALCDPTAHAEVLTLRKAGNVLKNYRLTGTVLYVTLEPCAMCVGALVHARVARVVYGTADPRSGAAGSVVALTNVPAFNHHVEVVGGVKARECSELLRAFFQARRGNRS